MSKPIVISKAIPSMCDTRQPYGPRRSELEKMATEWNAKHKKNPIEFGSMDRAQLMAALNVTVDPIMQEGG